MHVGLKHIECAQTAKAKQTAKAYMPNMSDNKVSKGALSTMSAKKAMFIKLFSGPYVSWSNATCI